MQRQSPGARPHRRTGDETIPVPAGLVHVVGRVARQMEAGEADWEAVRLWSLEVGLDTAARAVRAVARSIDPEDPWSLGQWQNMISGAGGRTGGLHVLPTY